MTDALKTTITKHRWLMAYITSPRYWCATASLSISNRTLPPKRLGRFIERFDPTCFGITYDTGNSAALGYRPSEEIAVYGHRITNVHIKDRLRNGPTVALGRGDADIAGAVAALKSVNYGGYYMLQTARASDGDHVGAACAFRDYLAAIVKEME